MKKIKIISVGVDTCQVCGDATLWDESFGYNKYIVCPRCHELMKKEIFNGSYEKTDSFILSMGLLREKILKDYAD